MLQEAWVLQLPIAQIGDALITGECIVMAAVGALDGLTGWRTTFPAVGITGQAHR